MNWIRENKTLGAIIGLMVVGGLGLTAVLVMSYFSHAASLEEYQAASNQAASLKGAKLFPDEKNVLEKEAAITEYEDVVSSLGAVLLALQQPVKPLSDTEFQARLKSSIAETRLATKEKQLPKDFAFGFDSYTSGLPKSAEAASQLGDYLAAVVSIVNMLIADGVTSIDSLERSELAIEKGVPPPPPEPPKETRKPASSKKGAKGKQAVKKAAPPKEIAKVVERRTVTLTFTADQGPLQTIMNKLASPSEMVHFTVTRQLRVENEKQEGPGRGSLPRLETKTSSTTETTTLPDGETPPPAPPPVVTPAGGAAAPVPTPATPAKVQVVEPAKPAAPDAQAVFGEEKLKVYMEIDLVRFLEPKPAEAGAAK